MISRLPILVLGMWAACLIGCGGPGDSLERPKGKVTFAGQPVKYGIIEFVPDSGKNHAGPAASAEIVDGLYDTATDGQGIAPGAHLVRITAFEERPPVTTSTDDSQPVQNKPPIFSGFTIESEVKAGEANFDVPETARGFDLMNPAKGAPRGIIP